MKHFVDKWNQLKGKEKTETRNNITSCDDALQSDGIGQLSAEHRKRGEIIKSLENFQKKLNQGHHLPAKDENGQDPVSGRPGPGKGNEEAFQGSGKQGGFP